MKTLAFLEVEAVRATDIQSSLSKAYADELKRNRAILLSIIDIIVTLGQRNIPFRGHGWNKVEKREDGNFDFFVHWKSTFDPILDDHLKHAKKNATYLSPDIQNELIHLAGLEVREAILDSAKSAQWFSILADECTDVATHEQMSMCIRFVDEESSQPIVREEFLGFVQMDKTDAASITEAIVEFLKDCNLDMSNLRGQGYDGASVMAGQVSGVSTRIHQLQPKALYQHCRAHNLDLDVNKYLTLGIYLTQLEVLLGF